MISEIAKRLEMDNYDLEAVFTPTIVNLLIPYFVFMSALFPYMHSAYYIYVTIITIVFFLTKSAAIDYAETLIIIFDKTNHNEE